jgi:hypothetical protein
MIFHSLLQNYAEYKETLDASATRRRDELDDVLWSILLKKMSENQAADRGSLFAKEDNFLRGETCVKNEMLLLNSWQPESNIGDKPRSCHMQTMKFKCKDSKDGKKHEGDVKVYWNKRKPPG